MDREDKRKIDEYKKNPMANFSDSVNQSKVGDLGQLTKGSLLTKIITIVFVLGILILLSILVGCGESQNDVETDWEPTPYTEVNELKDVSITVKEETISPIGVTVVMENNSDMDLEYGEYFSVEKNIEDEWYIVPDKDNKNYAFPDIAYSLPAGESVEVDINIEWRYGEIEPGEYRIIKDVIDFRETGDYDVYYLSAEFRIQE